MTMEETSDNIMPKYAGSDTSANH